MKNNIVGSLNLGIISNKSYIHITLTNKNKEICKYLYLKYFILSYSCNYKNNNIIIYFYNNSSKKFIYFLKTFSNSGRRQYINYRKLKNLYVYNKHYLILSTSKGILTNKEAMLKKVGGELLFLIKC